MKNAIYLLFPYPVMVCAENYKFTSGEKEYIAELEMIDNTGNLMSKNDKILDSEELSNLRRYIDEQIFIFKKKLLQIKDENEIYITQSWANASNTSQFHHKHKHPNSVISGVMFFDENDDESLPPIRFHRTLEMFPLEFEFDNLNESNAGCRSFETVQGGLILFPSLLEHAISFNTFVRGVVGGRKQLNEVEIA